MTPRRKQKGPLRTAECWRQLPALKNLMWLQQTHQPHQHHHRRLTLELRLLRAIDRTSVPLLCAMYQNILHCAQHVQRRHRRSALPAKRHFYAPNAKQMLVLEDAKPVPCVNSSTRTAGAVSMEDRLGRETRRWLMISKDSRCNSRIISADHRNRSLKRRTASMTMGPSYASEKSLPRSAVNTRTTQESSMASHPTGRSGVMDDHQIRSRLCFSCLLHS